MSTNSSGQMVRPVPKTLNACTGASPEMRRAAVGHRTTTALCDGSGPYPSTSPNMPTAGSRSRTSSITLPRAASASPAVRTNLGVKGTSIRYPRPIGRSSILMKLWEYQVCRNLSLPAFSSV